MEHSSQLWEPLLMLHVSQHSTAGTMLHRFSEQSKYFDLIKQNGRFTLKSMSQTGIGVGDWEKEPAKSQDKI